MGSNNFIWQIFESNLIQNLKLQPEYKQIPRTFAVFVRGYLRDLNVNFNNSNGAPYELRSSGMTLGTLKSRFFLYPSFNEIYLPVSLNLNQTFYERMHFV